MVRGTSQYYSFHNAILIRRFSVGKAGALEISANQFVQFKCKGNRRNYTHQ